MVIFVQLLRNCFIGLVVLSICVLSSCSEECEVDFTSEEYKYLEAFRYGDTIRYVNRQMDTLNFVLMKSTCETFNNGGNVLNSSACTMKCVAKLEAIEDSFYGIHASLEKMSNGGAIFELSFFPQVLYLNLEKDLEELDNSLIPSILVNGIEFSNVTEVRGNQMPKVGLIKAFFYTQKNGIIRFDQYDKKDVNKLVIWEKVLK